MADGVWCTDWDRYEPTQVAEVFAEGYDAPLETVDPFFTRGDGAYDQVAASLGAPGCTPGAVRPTAPPPGG